jgi:hypothetical protein
MARMAGYQALAAAGVSIVELLRRHFGDFPEAAGVTAFLASSSELKTLKTNTGETIQKPAVSVYVYRVSVDKETRPGWSAVASVDGIARLPLRAHILLAAWANNALEELRWLGLAADILESHPILTGLQLMPISQNGGMVSPWRPGDAVQVVTDDLALESMSEAFQALTTEFRLTLPYIARVICLDGPRVPGGEPVSLVADRTERVRA